MATKSLGRVSIVPQGDYDENRVYKRLDLVKNDGKTYLSIKEDNVNPLSDAESWMLLTESGRFEDLTPQELNTILQPLNEATEAANEAANTANEAAQNAVTGSTSLGTITPSSTIPAEGNVWGFAEEGTYPNAGNITVADNTLGILTRVGGTWSKVDLEFPQNTAKIVAWTAQTYTSGSQVIYNGKIYEANSATVAGDVPGTSLKWVSKISGDETFRKKIPTINLFDKNDVALSVAASTTTGEIVASNSSNAITLNFIPVEEVSYTLSVIDSTGISFTCYIFEYGADGGFLGYKALGSGVKFMNYKPASNVKFIRLNINLVAGVTFTQIFDSLVFEKVSNMQPYYLPFGAYQNPKELPDDLYFKRETVTNFFGSFGTYNSSTDTFTIPSGNVSFSGSMFSKKTYARPGRTKYIFKATTTDKSIFALLDYNTIALIENGRILKTNKKIIGNTLYVEVDDVFNAGEIVAFTLIPESTTVNFPNPVDIAFDLKYQTIGEDGKPTGYDSIDTQAVNAIVDSKVSSERTLIDAEIEDLRNDMNTQFGSVPTIVNQTIGSDINAYLTQHIDDFTFSQPNYIQANSSFNFLGLTSAANGKFISIIEDIDLGGQTLDFINQGVKDLKLVFNGGRILNGKIKSNNTKCIFNSNQAFKNVEILNQFNNEYALPEWFGAKIDGVDGGIGVFTYDDSFALNQALKFTARVKLVGNRTMIVKKPIILQSGSILEFSGNFELKLGDAANCTLIKNKHIDLLHDGWNPPTYPQGYKRDSNISIIGNGIINGNGNMQYREGSAGQSYEGNPAVNNTPVFRDGDNMQYIGFMIKFADIDNLIVDEGITLKDGRTYMMAIGGIKDYILKPKMVRGYKFINQDGIHIHGDCYNGLIDVSGVAGDDLIAVTTSEAGNLSIRTGDVKKLRINCYNYGFNAGATYSAPIYDGKSYGAGNAFRPIRLTYTDHIIDDVVIENIFSNTADHEGVVVISNLPNTNTTSGDAKKYGIGKVGRVTLRNISVKPNMAGLVEYGGKTTIENIVIENVDFGQMVNSTLPALIKPGELWTGDATDYDASVIGNIIISNVINVKGNSHPAPDGIINVRGILRSLTIDNFIMNDDVSSPSSYDMFIKGNVKKIKIVNSEIHTDTIFSLSNADCHFMSSNCDFRKYNNGVSTGVSLVGTIPHRVNSTDIVLGSNPSGAEIGDKILKSDGIYLYTNAWNKL